MGHYMKVNGQEIQIFPSGDKFIGHFEYGLRSGEGHLFLN